MECRHCNSTNTIRYGRDRYRRQRWKCHACGRVSSEGADPENKGGEHTHTNPRERRYTRAEIQRRYRERIRSQRIAEHKQNATAL